MIDCRIIVLLLAVVFDSLFLISVLTEKVTPEEANRRMFWLMP